MQKLHSTGTQKRGKTTELSSSSAWHSPRTLESVAPAHPRRQSSRPAWPAVCSRTGRLSRQRANFVPGLDTGWIFFIFHTSHPRHLPCTFTSMSEFVVPDEPLGPIKRVLRTPEGRFLKIPRNVFPFQSNYIMSNTHGRLRIHYLDEGKGRETILCMHGEPSWCFLYRHMIPLLVRAGYRVVCPDLVGFGKSDKPASRGDYSYERQVDWMCDVVIQLGLDNVTLFGQDWGGLIGLRVVSRLPERFLRVCVANTSLPAGKGATPFFTAWATKISQRLASWSYMFQKSTLRKLSPAELYAYDAPFPTEAYKVASRVYPQLVPVTMRHGSVEENKGAWKRVFYNWKKPLLTIFGSDDLVFKGAHVPWIKRVPGARGQPHAFVKAGHFLQEDAPEEVVAIFLKFMRQNKVQLNPPPASFRSSL